MTTVTRPLHGIRVVELGQLLAGPFAGSILAYFGAEVIKVEPPGGDPMRSWRGMEDGTSLWWRSLSRNKKCLSIDLREERGRELTRRLIATADVVIENFRPGTLEAWEMGPEVLRQDHEDLIVVRVSGYGQTGRDARKPGFASVCEAAAGLRHLTGMPGEEPVRSNLSLGDSLAGLHAALGALLALYHRDTSARPGQVVDVSIVESILSVMESVIPEQDRLGTTRGPSGTSITGIVPTGQYTAGDGGRIVIGANSESIFDRLLTAMGRVDLIGDSRFRGNAARVEHRDELEALIAAWIGGMPAGDAIAVLERHGVPCSTVRDASAVLDDPHLAERGSFDTIDVGGRPLRVTGLRPLLRDTPGGSDWAGPDLGSHEREVLEDILGLETAEIQELRAAGVLGKAL